MQADAAAARAADGERKATAHGGAECGLGERSVEQSACQYVPVVSVGSNPLLWRLEGIGEQ
jgi:hypothetical protein